MKVVSLRSRQVKLKPRVVKPAVKWIDRQILACLREHKGKAVRSDRLIFAGWGDRETGTRENLRVRILKIRRMLKGEEIVTVWGDGYVLVDEGQPIDINTLEVVG